MPAVPREEAFGDAVYDAWRRGMNPDNVSRDDVDEGWYRSYDREQAAEYAVECVAKRALQNTQDEDTTDAR